MSAATARAPAPPTRLRRAACGRLVAVAPRGLAERRPRLPRRVRSFASGRPAASHSRSPRTRPTTGASPATSPRAAGSCRTPSGRYATPARDPVTGAFGFFFPRPAFEIWLPLTSAARRLLAMLVSGSTAYATTLPVAAVARRARAGGRLADRGRPRRGAPAPARAGADAGARRRPRRGGRRCRSCCRRPSSSRRTPFALPALVACLLMVRLLRRPPARALDRAPGRAGRPHRRRRRWPATRRSGSGSPGRSSPRRRSAGAGLRAVARAVAVPGIVAVAVMAPWLVRNWFVFGSPAARAGDHQRLGDHGQRDLRLEGAGHAAALPGARPGGLDRAARRRVRPQPPQRAPDPGRADRRGRPGRPARGPPASARSGRSSCWR